MYRDKKRFGQDAATVVRSKDPTFNFPLKLKEPAKVFVCSWSDFFIEDADSWRDEAWDIIRRQKHLTFQILTKRPENITERLPDDWPLDNVWLGVTAENQKQADKRISLLLEVLAEKRFLSVEPMLGSVDIGFKLNYELIDWVIVGGESGPSAREMKEKWARRLLIDCELADVPFFMKQMSGTTKKEREAIPEHLNIKQFPVVK
jgi:protein gp37